MKIRTPVLLFLVAAFIYNSVAQDFRFLENTALEEIRQKSIAGASLAVIRGDSVFYAGAVGFADKQAKVPMEPEMLFRLGSTTKMFVALAALNLVDQGKLDLQAPIRAYISGLPPKLGALTAHQLLSHTAGLFDDAPMVGPDDESVLGKEIHSWKDEKIFLEPGKYISYSNPGYWLVGYIIETISGKAFADAMEELVFRPLGMKHSTFRPVEAARFPLALGHDKNLNIILPLANHAGTWPSGSMFTNVGDLSRFMIAFLNDGILQGKRVISERVMKLLRARRVQIPERDKAWYGYGLVFETRRGAGYVFHTGSRNGYGSILRMVPENKFGVVVLANRSGAIMGATADVATEMFVALQNGNEEAQFSYIREDADQYLGEFECPPNIKVELFLSGILHMKRGMERVPVRKYSDSKYTNSIVPFTVTRGIDGRVEYIHAELHTLKRIE